MRVFQVLVLLMSIAPVSALLSQRNDPLLRPGARVRWAVEDTVDRATSTTQFTYREGRLDSLDGHSLVLGSAGAARRNTIDADTARASITRMVYAETSIGFERHAWQGAIAGLVVGAAVGYLVADPGRFDATRCVDTGLASFCGDQRALADSRGPRTVAFGVGGALAGGIAGHLIRTEQWTPIDVHGLRRWLGLE